MPDENEQVPVVAAQPCPSTFAVNIARIPNPLKGETHSLVLLSIFTVIGRVELFIEPDQAIAVSQALAVAARECSGKVVLASPSEVVAIDRARKAGGS